MAAAARLMVRVMDKAAWERLLSVWAAEAVKRAGVEPAAGPFSGLGLPGVAEAELPFKGRGARRHGDRTNQKRCGFRPLAWAMAEATYARLCPTLTTADPSH